MNNEIPLWLDTDIGSDIDDAVALAYLLREPRCRLLGLSTVTGPVADRARVASALALAAGRPDLPIFPGYSDTLSGPGQPQCPQAEVLPQVKHRPDFRPDPDAALAALLAAARNRPGSLTLLTIGPLSNVARFFQAAPQLPALLKEVVLMAGVFHPDQPRAEWNVLCDPVAADLVARAPVARRWYGLDVTLQCWLPVDEVRRRFQGPVLRTVARFADVWFRRRDRITFHDPLAAAAVFEPDLCRYESARVDVLTSGQCPGRTLPRPMPPGQARADSLALQVDPQRFFSRYFSVFNL